MKDLKSVYKNEFDKVTFSKEQEKNLRENVILKYKRRKRYRNITLSIFIIVGILIIGTGISYADEIKKTLNGLFAKVYTFENSEGKTYNRIQIKTDVIKELKYDAKLNGPTCESYSGIISTQPSYPECLSTYLHEDIENILDIKILKSDLFRKNEYYLEGLKENDGLIAALGLKIYDVLNDEAYTNSILNMSMFMRTKYGDLSDIKILDGEYSEDITHEYYVRNLDTTAYIYDFGTRWKIIFLTYDDIVYSFFYSQNLKNRGNTYEEIKGILDSLHY